MKTILAILTILITLPVLALEVAPLPPAKEMDFQDRNRTILVALNKAITDKPAKTLFLVTASFNSRFGTKPATHRYRVIYDKQRRILILLNRLEIPDGDDDLIWQAMFNINPKDWTNGLPERKGNQEIFHASDGNHTSAKRTFTEALHTFSIDYPEHKNLLTFP
jgi:hypothetical protein